MVGGKSSRLGSVDSRFTDLADQAPYLRYKSVGITPLKIINPRTLTYPVLDLLTHTTLTFILTLVCPFNSELMYKFFASLRISLDYTTLQSYDYHELLRLSTTRDKLHVLVLDLNFDWSPTNHFLRNTNVSYHDGISSYLVKDARTIQHFLRSSIILKVGERIHITPLLSMTTYYIMAHRNFNATNLIFFTLNT
ncbi:hypothetical protein M5K25_027678 [Dendrobium thyrsiflorum]|uniref:Uncharacterized protein n=1 Tax=Dendrobium thyrsiflorum TaxID=117978 RepID=A0ABD0TUF5_DENTH